MLDSIKKSALTAVIMREIDRMCNRPYYYFIIIVLPLFCLFFMSTIFNNGQMENIPVGIVDLDNSAASRSLIRDFNAVPTFDVIKKYSDQSIAREDLQKKRIYAYMVIPANYDDRIGDDKKVSVCFYYHYALLSVGGEALSGFQRVITPTVVMPAMEQAVSLGMTNRAAEEFISPVDSEFFSLFNPDLNYAIYLSSPFFFVFLQIIILISTLYIIGIELKDKTAVQWLETAKGNILVALLGKYIPYTVVFTIVMIFANYVLFYLFNIPNSSNMTAVNIAAFLLIIASQALGIFIYSLFPVLGISISFVSMIGSLGATLYGMTFPVPSMYPFVRVMSTLLPVRHFILILQNLLYGNNGFVYAWQNYVVLVGFIILPVLMSKRIKSSILNYKYEKYE